MSSDIIVARADAQGSRERALGIYDVRRHYSGFLHVKYLRARARRTSMVRNFTYPVRRIKSILLHKT
jgi:hypothetical protein